MQHSHKFTHTNTRGAHFRGWWLPARELPTLTDTALGLHSALRSATHWSCDLPPGLLLWKRHCNSWRTPRHAARLNVSRCRLRSLAREAPHSCSATDSLNALRSRSRSRSHSHSPLPLPRPPFTPSRSPRPARRACWLLGRGGPDPLRPRRRSARHGPPAAAVPAALRAARALLVARSGRAEGSRRRGDRTDDKTAIYSVLPHASPPSLPLPVRFLFADRRRGRRVRVVRLNALRGAAAWRLGENRRSVRTDAGRAPQSRVDLLPTRHGFWGRAIRTTTTTTTTMTTTTTRVLSRPTAGRAPAVPPEPGNDSILARDRLVVRGRATWCSASPAR